jgi:exopolysaccharide production protein ExoQ
LLVMSKSATGVVVTAMLLALLPFRKLLYLRTRKLIAVSALLLPLASVVIFFAVEYIDEIFLALGRTSSLSGRIPLWRIVIEEIAARPIRGYGFAAFWTSWEGQRVSDTVSWDVAVPHAHNGFLEVTLGLGLVGVTLLLLSIGQGFRGGLRIARDRGEIENAWPLLFIVYSVLYNLTESSFIAVNGIYWMAFVANSFWLVRASREESRETKLELAQEQEPAYSV